MADITRLSRFVGGLPRDVDMTTNSLQVLSLKVGTTAPAELTKAMVELLNTINTTGIPAANVSAEAKQAVLESKLAAMRVGVINFVPTTGNTSDVVTTDVLGGATTDTAIGAGAAISAANAKGIFVGTVSGAADVGKTLIRVNGTDNGFDDGSGDEIYGVLTYVTGGASSLSILQNSYTSNYRIYDNQVGITTYISYGQTFKLASGGVVDKISVGINKDTDATVITGTVSFEIYATSGGLPTGSALASAIVNASSLTSISGTFSDFTFSSPFTANAGVTYALVITANSISHNGTLLFIALKGTDSGDVYTDGQAVQNSGSSWSAISGVDLRFRVYSAPAPSYSLEYKKSDGTPYTITASDTSTKMDFYFIEVMDLYSFGVDRLLMPAIGGVVDATTASSIYSESTARLAADSSLQAQIDAEITNRTNADDYEYSARVDADATLQDNIDGELASRVAADNTLQSNINAEITARQLADSTLQANLDAEITARTLADSTLQSNIDGEANARSAADQTLQANIDAEATARSLADSTLQANIDAEATARDLADQTLQANIDAEVTARELADSTLQSQISGLDSADSTLQANIDAEITARMAADSTLQANIDAEATARDLADSTLQANIDAEASARDLADQTLQANIDAETTARMGADSTLQANIDAETTARELADSTLQANINAEITARELADSTLLSNINAEATARMDADSTLQANIDAEATARDLADQTLQSNIDAEVTARDLADSTLQANIDAEATARDLADQTLQANIDAEVTARELADSTLQANIDAEASARELADSSLQAQIEAINVSVVDVSYTAPTGGIAAGDVVILSTTAAGEVEKANANGIATCECVVGVALETITAGNPVLVRAFGEATVTTDGTNFEIGKRVYVAANATSGLGTKTPPATVNNVVYLVGGATDTNKVFVNTNLEYVVM